MKGTGWREIFVGGSARAEAAVVRRFINEINQVQANLQGRSGAGKPDRAFHAKALLATTDAEFVIADDIAEELRVDLFQPGARYPAIVRVSNASGVHQDDDARDMRGLAFRVVTGDGQGHDYLMTNAPASHARDARQFVVFAKAMSGSRLWLLPRLLFGLGPFEAVRMFRTLIGSTGRKVESAAKETFWSRAPIAMGEVAAKYLARPAAAAEPDRPATGPNYLRDDLAARLANGEVIYDFCIQRFVDERRTPIEDGAVEWTEVDAPPEPIARLVIHRQDLTRPDVAEMTAEVDAVEFNPWNTSHALRPLGGLNRARQIVYASSQVFRANRKALSGSSVLGRVGAWLLKWTFAGINRVIDWHRLPGLIGAFNLLVFRDRLRQENVHDPGPQAPAASPAIRTIPAAAEISRQSDGRFNDPSDPMMGAAGTRFGRNMPVAHVHPDPSPGILEPSPREVSQTLLTRNHFVPATTLNLLAAAWIQFMTHDWFNHAKVPKADRGPDDDWRIDLAEDDDWPERPMRIGKTPRYPSEVDDPAAPPAYANTNTHWWDASQIYGGTKAATSRLRSHEKGKLIVQPDGLLPFDPETGIEHTGFNDNWWVGLSLLHTVFSLEHNAICDRLGVTYPTWNDDQLFRRARLINIALMAKIHTIEWTPGILGHPALQIGMNANWSGLAGGRLASLLPGLASSEAFGGIPGSPVDHHAAPYALTEEFVSVYRMHPLIPDDYNLYAHTTRAKIAAKTLPEIQGAETRTVLEQFDMRDLFYSFGVTHPGAITLHNYPRFLQTHRRSDGEIMDLGAVDVLRDRERGVPRYNQFRTLLHRRPAKSFEDITDNPVWAKELREVYGGDVGRVDTMVGMFAETPPRGFGFSDTAFRIFVVMASRRLKSDRFFTTDFSPEVYTPAGMDWIDRNDMRSVIARHYPDLAPYLRRVGNAFAPWPRA